MRERERESNPNIEEVLVNCVCITDLDHFHVQKNIGCFNIKYIFVTFAEATTLIKVPSPMY